jgi:hypothetical protein
MTQGTVARSRFRLRTGRADNGEVGHPDFTNGPFFDEADVCDARFIPGVARPDVIQEPAVDLENNLQMSAVRLGSVRLAAAGACSGPGPWWSASRRPTPETWPSARARRPDMTCALALE